MNTGLQDAYNLGWKLALVAAERANSALLDSYEAERIPVAQRLLDSTDRAFRLIVADNAIAALLRTSVVARLAAFAMSRPGVDRIAFRVVSQTGIRYPSSPLSQSVGPLAAGAPRAGDRFPWLSLRFAAGAASEDDFARLDDQHFHLLTFGQPAPPAIAELGDLLRTHAIPPDADNDATLARARIAQPSFYLLRPDGYVGLCGGRLDPSAVSGYAGRRLHLRSAST